eukprot:m.92869 g.92869  ORF g.92869 m.92869 type:complete len:1046 (+) comp51183_c0_seq1:84-3221(+)
MAPMLAVLLLACASAVVGQISSGWRMSGFDISGGSASQYVGMATNNAILYQTGTNTSSEPSIMHYIAAHPAIFPTLEKPGTVLDLQDTSYFVNQTGFVAVRFDGVVVWSFACADETSAVTTPALTSDFDAVILVCSGPSSNVFAVRTTDGSQIWSVTVPSMILAFPLINDDLQFVFIASIDGNVNALNLVDGSFGWDAPASTGGDIIQGTPCSDNTLLFVFTLAGSVHAFYLDDGDLAWSNKLISSGVGFSSACAVSTSPDGTKEFVAAGSLDFSTYVISIGQNGTLQCTYATTDLITQGVASINSSFLVPSTDGTLSSIYPTLGLCYEVFKLAGLSNPSRPAFDSHLVAVVGTTTGLQAFDCKWVTLSRVVWAFTTIGDSFNSPAIGANGNVFASTKQGVLFAVGVTSDFIQQHVRTAAMAATAVLGDASANATLAYLCLSIPAALEQPDVTILTQNLTFALNESCSMYSLVSTSQDPWGAPPSYVYFQPPNTFIDLLQQDLLPNLVDLDARLQNLSSTSATDQQLMASLQDVINNYDQQREQLEQAASTTLSIVKTIAGTVASTEARLEVTTDLALDQITNLVTTWVQMAINFANAAIADSKAGVAEFEAALNDFAMAVLSILNPFAWGHIKSDIQNGINALKKGIEYIMEAAFWAADAAYYVAEWLNLVRVAGVFFDLLTLDEALLKNDLSFSQALPFILDAQLELSSVQVWLGNALKFMKGAKGGEHMATLLDEFIHDTQTLITSDLAFYATFNQYQAQLSQISSLDNQLQAAENSLDELKIPRGSIGVALQMVMAQQYSLQIQVIQTARQACQQYAYWVLEDCPSSVDMPAYPTPQDIDTFVTQFNQLVIQHEGNVTGQLWAQISYNTTANPEAFTNSSQGVFYLQVSLPQNGSFYNVRTSDYRAYFLPQGIEVNSGVLDVEFEHDGMSQFLDSNGTLWSFAHNPWTDGTPLYYTNTLACPISQHVCLPPQCASTFNLSPYGLWTLRVNPDVFVNISAIESVVLQFNIAYEIENLPPPVITIFEGGDGSPQIPAVMCPTQ